MRILALNLAAALTCATAPANAGQLDNKEGDCMTSERIQTGATPFDLEAREAQVASGNQRIAPLEPSEFSEEARQIAQTSGWAFDAAAYNLIFVLPNGGIELYSLADGALRTLLPASEDSEWQRYPLHIADEQQLVWIYEFNFSEGESGTLLALGFDGQEIARYTVGGNSWPLFGFCPNGDMLVGQLADGATPSTEEAEITIYRATADGISELLTTSMGSNAPNIVCLINE